MVNEVVYLYVLLVYKLGLYKLKLELEDLLLKYIEYDIYYYIKEKLNEMKKLCDCYIVNFIVLI